MAPCKGPGPVGWGCHRGQLTSSKAWLQGWALKVSGVPHSSSHAMAWHTDQRQRGLGHLGKAGCRLHLEICPHVLMLPGLVDWARGGLGGICAQSFCLFPDTTFGCLTWVQPRARRTSGGWMRPCSAFQQGRGAWDGDPAWGGWHSSVLVSLHGHRPRVAVAMEGEGNRHKACLLHPGWDRVWVGF